MTDWAPIQHLLVIEEALVAFHLGRPRASTRSLLDCFAFPLFLIHGVFEDGLLIPGIGPTMDNSVVKPAL